MRPLRKLEAVSVVSSVGVLILTYLLIGEPEVYEANLTARMLLAELGWYGAAGLKLVLVAVAFSLLEAIEEYGLPGFGERMKHGFVSASAMTAAILFVANLLNDAVVAVKAGPPTSVHWLEFAPFLLFVSVLAAILFVRPDPRRILSAIRDKVVPSPSRSAAKSLFMVALIVGSIVSPIAVVQPAEAKEGPRANDYADGDIDHFTSEGWVVKDNTNAPFDDKVVQIQDSDGGGSSNTDDATANFSFNDANDVQIEVWANPTTNCDADNDDLEISNGKEGSSGTLQFRWVGCNSNGNGEILFSGQSATFDQHDKFMRVVATVNGTNATMSIFHPQGDNGTRVAKIEDNSISSDLSESNFRLSTDNDEIQIAEWRVHEDVHTVTGYVKKQDGSLVKDATVRVNESSRTMEKTKTNENGKYNITVKGGTYKMNASKSGEGSHVKDSVSVSGHKTDVNFTLGGGNSVSGYVKDQKGNACKNCTVEVVGVDRNQISTSDSDQSKIARAKELLEKASDPLPDSWDPDLKLTGPDGKFSGADGEYVAIHSAEDWGFTRMKDVVNLNNPKVNVPANEELVLSTWDPSPAGVFVQDGVDNDLPGVTTDTDVIIRELGPEGDVVSKKTYTTGFSQNEGFDAFGKTHKVERHVYLDPGVYEVTAKGSPVEYTIVAGEVDQLIESFASDLKTKAEGLQNDATQAAQDFDNKQSDGKFTRKTDTTNTSGYYSASFGASVDVVAVSAYRIDGAALPNMSSPSPQDMRDWIRDNDYNGSVYFSRKPKKFELPASNANVTVHKFASPPFSLINRFADLWEDWLDRLRNGDLTDLGDLFGPPLDQWTDDKLEDAADNTTDLIEDRDDLIEEFEERNEQQWDDFRDDLEDRLNSDSGGSGPSNDELREDIEDMEEVLNKMQSELEKSEPPEITMQTNVSAPEVGGGGISNPDQDTFDVVSFKQTFDGNVKKDDVLAVWNDYDGSSHIIADKYITVNSRPGVDDEVIIEDYPVPDGSAGGQMSVTVVSEDGEVGHSTETINNPAFGGQIPDIRSFDVSTLQPGPDEEVSIEPHFDSASTGVDKVEVFGPDGNTISSSLNSDDIARFRPNASGEYFVQFTFNESGQSFVQGFRLLARNTSNDWPESVYVKNGRLGLFTLAGDKVEDADVEVSDSGNEITVTALINPESGTNEIHFYMSEAPNSVEQSLKLRVLSGESLTKANSLSRHVGIFIHGRELREDGILYREASDSQEPIPHSGETRAGKVTEGKNGGSVIHTFSDGQGRVTVTVNNNPGILERITYEVGVFIRKSPIPVPSSPLSVFGGWLVALVGTDAVAPKPV